MRLEKVLRSSVAVLAAAFAVQFAYSYYNKPDPVYHASWKDNPKNVAEAKGLAKRAVTGVVLKVEKGEDLIVEAKGEANGQDRLPTEVVTLKVEGKHKGDAGPEVKVYRLGSNKGLTNKPAPTEQAPPKPEKGAVDRPAQPIRLTEEQTRTIMLEDDPPYRQGERYVLLLDDGPSVKVGGAEVKTQRPISPDGRFRVTQDDKLQPISRSAFANQLRGKARADLERDLK